MPTYEYKCQKCSNEFEKFQSITAEAKAKCPRNPAEKQKE